MVQSGENGHVWEVFKKKAKVQDLFMEWGWLSRDTETRNECYKSGCSLSFRIMKAELESTMRRQTRLLVAGVA